MDMTKLKECLYSIHKGLSFFPRELMKKKIEPDVVILPCNSMGREVKMGRILGSLTTRPRLFVKLQGSDGLCFIK